MLNATRRRNNICVRATSRILNYSMELQLQDADQIEFINMNLLVLLGKIGWTAVETSSSEVKIVNNNLGGDQALRPRWISNYS